MILAAATVFGFAACTVNELSPIETPVRTLRTFTCGFDEDVTKTTINRQGKTLWSEGDKILLTNGTEKDTVIVDALYAGEKYCEFSTALEGTLYAVYPCDAFGSVTEDGKLIVNVPSSQNGTFGSANIACAVADDAARKVSLKNVTSVLKFKVPANTSAPVVFASVTANESVVSGPLAISFSEGNATVSPVEGASHTSSVSIKVDGAVGDFYVSVIPGICKAGFNLTVATLDFEYAYESKTTVSEKELLANDLYDLGTIGYELKPMGGDGSENNPYLITSLGEMVVLAYYVNEGNTLKEKHVKLMNDISGVSVPVGIYDETTNPATVIPFQGEFDGNGKTIGLSIDITDGKGAGLFAALRDSAYVHDLKINGSVSSTYKNVGALASSVETATVLNIKNVESSASVSGKNTVGGLIGYVSTKSTGLVIDNCINTGTVTANEYYAGGVIGASFDGGNNITLTGCRNSGSITSPKCVGGIIGFAKRANLSECENSGAVTSTDSNGGTTYPGWASDALSTGGITGFSNSTTIANSVNNGPVTAVNKAGGITGIVWWSNVHDCINNGTVHCSKGEMGGIIAWGAGWSPVMDCVNTGEVISDSEYCIGGIAGRMSVYYISNGKIYYQASSPNCDITRCTNKGKVTGHNTGIGGICGYTMSYSNNGQRVNIRHCVNEGDVISTAASVGGIVGHSYDYGSWTMNECVNNKNIGTVQGTYNVGGIVGYFQGRLTKSRLNMHNCENNGHIISTRTDNVAYVGGIVGYTNNLTDQGLYVENCLNSGDVTYSCVEKDQVYAGGIAGKMYGSIYNCVNTGKVGPVEGEISDTQKKTIGALAGDKQIGNRVVRSFYLEGSNLYAFGTSAVSDYSSIFECKADGTLIQHGNGTEGNYWTSGTNTYVNAIDILNSQNYAYKWTEGPKFSFSGQVSIDDKFDLGNGGNL